MHEQVNQNFECDQENSGLLISESGWLHYRNNWDIASGLRNDFNQKNTAIAYMLSLLFSALTHPAWAAPERTEHEGFEQFARRCAPSVHPTTLAALVHVESDYNPYAIGVVGGQLARQPQSLDEAMATVSRLQAQGRNFSMGLGQVNRFNLQRHQVDYRSIFEPCRNLSVGAAILTECFTRAKGRFADDQQALRASLSCYYAGNFTTGYRDGYVRKVIAQVGNPPKPIPVVPALLPSTVYQDGAVTSSATSKPTIRKKTPQYAAGKADDRQSTTDENDIYVFSASTPPVQQVSNQASSRSFASDDNAIYSSVLSSGGTRE